MSTDLAKAPESAPSRSGKTRSQSSGTAAARLAPVIEMIFPSGAPIRFELWDGSGIGPEESPLKAIVRSKKALSYLVFAPGELGVARAYISGAIDLEGDLYLMLGSLEDAIEGHGPGLAEVALPTVRAALGLGLLGRPPEPPAVEHRPQRPWRRGARHSKARDEDAVRHHYDVGNDFYSIVLGSAMTYSCARFVSPETTLAEAQAAKHELICKKLGLDEARDARLLDIGCGWGSMAMHAASRYGARVVGVTLSPEQVRRARERVAEAGLEQLVEIRQQDYRELSGEQFDVVSSVGMFEHVGAARMGEYFSTVYGLLVPGGRLLNHAISKVGSSSMRGRTFINRYVFPDGELIDVGEVVRAMERAGFEVRDVESLREHYTRTLRSWVANLEAEWQRAVELTSEERARVWRLYMAASANSFERNKIAVHQVLGVKTLPAGESGMPATRRAWD